MCIFDITVTKTGFVTVKAKTKEEALKIANEIKPNDFEWSSVIEIADCQKINK